MWINLTVNLYKRDLEEICFADRAAPAFGRPRSASLWLIAILQSSTEMSKDSLSKNLRMDSQ